MHSFDNGTALTAKQDNWNQLQKFFRKIGISEIVTDDEVGRLIRCEDGVAITVLTKIYETLTQRKVQVVNKKPPSNKVAGYAKDTGAWKVRETLRKGGFGDESDLNTVSKVSRDASEEHEKEIHAGRSIDPDRFASVSIAVSNSQMAPRVLGEPLAENAPQVRVKEIQVKQLDRNVTHLRASKQMQIQSNGAAMNGNISPNSRHIRAVTPSGTNGYDDSSSQLSESSLGNGRNGGLGISNNQGQGALLPENAASLLNACISRIMGTHNVPTWDLSLEPLQNLLNLIESLHGGNQQRVNLPNRKSNNNNNNTNANTQFYNLINSVVCEIKLSTQQLAEASVITPKQYWKVSDLLISIIITFPYQSAAYNSTIDTFISLGKFINSKDPKSSLQLFYDFTLIKLISVLNDHPYKRYGILKILYSFTSSNIQSHIQCIKKLQSIIVNIQIFIHCLCILSSFEHELDLSLLDLYQYYSIIGLSINSPKIRSVSINVICNLYSISNGLISNLLPQLQLIAETENWWEIKCHLLTLAGNILQYRLPENITELDPATEDGNWREDVITEDENYALNFVSLILNKNSLNNIKKWGLNVLAKSVCYGEEVSLLYIDILESLSESERKYLLSLPQVTGNGNDNNGININNGNNENCFNELNEINIIERNEKRNQEENYEIITLPSSTGIPFTIKPLQENLNPLYMIRTIETKIISEKLEKLTSGMIQIINSCLQSVILKNLNNETSLHLQGSMSSAGSDVFQLKLTGIWNDIYNSLKDFIIGSLTDASCVYDGCCVLILYIIHSNQQDSILIDNKFINTLRVIYPNDKNIVADNINIRICQKYLEEFFEYLFYISEYYSAAVINAIEIFAKNYTINYEISNLQLLMKKFLNNKK